MAFFNRASWGARRPKSRNVVAPADRKEFVVHYSTGQELGRTDYAEWVKSIQNYHMDVKDWSDISYNFLIAGNGDIFEGRGWDVIGAHSPGHNTIGIGVCFLGNDDPGVQDVPEAARRSIRWLAEEADRHTGKKLVRLGHKDTQRKGYTSCPGEELHTWVHGGMPLVDEPGQAPVPPTDPYPYTAVRPATSEEMAPPVAPPAPTPTPQPALATPAEHDWTSEVIMNLPTLKQGANGQHVRNLQGLLVANGQSVVADGDFGPKTAAAVKRFQKAAGLSADGIVGPKTWRALLGA